MIFESISALFYNVSLFGLGMVLGLFSLIVGVMRGMNKDSDKWPLLFGILAWGIALIIPNWIFGALVFITGTIAISISFIPYMKEIGDSNVLTLVLIFLFMNIFIVGGSIIQDRNNLFINHLDDTSELASEFASYTLLLNNELEVDVSEDLLCNPKDETCTQPGIDKNWYEVWEYDPFNQLIALGKVMGMFLKIAGYVLVAPWTMTVYLAESSVINPIISSLIAVFIYLIYFIIGYRIFQMALGNRLSGTR